MRVLVCGGRRFGEMPGQAQYLFAELDRLHATHTFTELIQGGALGADNLAAIWAATRRVPCHTFEADWDALGRAAGPARNHQMLSEGRPDLVVAFPGGRGTANMLAQASRTQVNIVRLPYTQGQLLEETIARETARASTDGFA